MTGQNAGKIMPADSIRPCFDERLDLGFRRLALLHHGCCSEYWLVSAPRTNVGAHIRHASKLFRGGARSSVLPRVDIVAAGAIDRGEHAGERGPGHRRAPADGAVALSRLITGVRVHGRGGTSLLPGHHRG